jgi:hypothetical protein
MALQVPQFEPTYLSLDYLFSRIYNFIINFFSFLRGVNLNEFIGTLKMISAFFVVILLVILFYTWMRLYEMKKEMEEKTKEKELVKKQEEENPIKNSQWLHICDLFDSPKQSDWRLAIIESNTILEKLVAPMKIKGDTTGEKLKNVEPSDFRTAKFAREANYIRNRIAHDGLDFKLDQKEAYRVKGLYQSVFEEFNIL